MIPRFFRRVRVFLSFVWRVGDSDHATGRLYRISPATAWELALHYHPSPEEMARQYEETRRLVENLKRWPPYGIKPND
jgi:hypothetical protein